MQTEARGVHWEATAALLHYLSQNVHLDLDSEEENRLRVAGSRAPVLIHTWTHCVACPCPPLQMTGGAGLGIGGQQHGVLPAVSLKG